MAFKVTARTRSILNQIQKNPSVLLDVEGVENIFSSSVVFEKIAWDGDVTWDQAGATWDGSVKKSGVKSYINLKESTRAITQQIYPDKQGSSSIASVMLTIIDKNSEVAKAFALNTVKEILGKKCSFSLGFVGANYPEDFMPIMNAIIVDYAYEGGAVKITLSHADTLRKQAILNEYTSNLVGAITDVQTVIDVEDTAGLIESKDIATTYLAIEDEKVEVVSIDSETQLTVLRGTLGTFAVAHDDESELSSVYRLKEYPLTLAQKIMHSNADNSFFDSDIELVSFEYVSNTESIQNAIIFKDRDIELNTGLIENDIVEVDTYGQFTVDRFGKLDNGNSYIIVKEDLPTIVEVNQSWRFNSQYNVLSFGLGMLPFQVDNKSFEYIKTIFAPNFVEMDFFISEGIKNARDFINKELYFVSGCYGIPRNARSSVKFLSPPLTIDETPTLNEKNILNMTKLKPIRSVNKFYYNDILYAFSKSIRDGDFKSFTQFLDTDSIADFGIGNKQLRIESKGLARSTVTDIAIERLAGRFLDRYKRAATLVKGVKLSFKTGFNLQVGDVVLFGGSLSKLVDYDTGLRNLPLAKYEIINLVVDLSGEIKIDILSTGYSVVGTYGVFSPSSKVAIGSTTDKLILKEINNLDEFTYERDKWNTLVGITIRVRSEDYLYDENTKIVALNDQDLNAIDIEALPSQPPENAIVELATYDNYPAYTGDDLVDSMKLKYTFTMAQTFITSVASNQEFDVDDISQFFEGQLIAVHSDDFTSDNFESKIVTIVGNTITLEAALDFLPVIGFKVESRAFDDLDGYLFL
jgi:hypothetical protein